MINAGELTERITIERSVNTQNDVGENTLTWSTFATVWAKVESMSGREAERYAEIVGFSGHKVTMRPLTGFTSAMRIIYRTRTLEIGAINEFDSIRYLDVICTEKLPAEIPQ
jgi:SPP1 family predicted phage head-tail adaptor